MPRRGEARSLWRRLRCGAGLVLLLAAVVSCRCCAAESARVTTVKGLARRGDVGEADLSAAKRGATTETSSTAISAPTDKSETGKEPRRKRRRCHNCKTGRGLCHALAALAPSRLVCPLRVVEWLVSCSSGQSSARFGPPSPRPTTECEILRAMAGVKGIASSDEEGRWEAIFCAP